MAPSGAIQNQADLAALGDQVTVAVPQGAAFDHAAVVQIFAMQSGLYPTRGWTATHVDGQFDGGHPTDGTKCAEC